MADDMDMSNPHLLSPPRANNGKERRNPSITPRKFRRFFTPRSRVPTRISPARQALQDLAVPFVSNRYQTPAPSSPLLPPTEDHQRDENIDHLDIRLPKRRKFQHTPDSSPCRPSLMPDPNNGRLSPSPSTRSALLSPIRSLQAIEENIDSDQDESEDELPPQPRPLRRLVPVTSRGFAGQLAQRQLGGMPRAGRSYMSFPTSDWRVHTADFYSRPDDVHSCVSHDGPGRCIPFCAAACHRNSLTAVGDEEGRVRLLESSGGPTEPFSRIHLCFQAHSNAIIDLDFSDDDHRLATASGDQTGRVIDMMTQTPISILQHHTASLKQVRFQPGKSNSSVLATSSRDGSVQIWDLRCSGPLVQDVLPPQDRETALRFRRPPPKQGCAVNSLYHAHARTSRQVQQATAGQGDTPSRRELPARIGDVSVTTLQFLPEGQEHLLLTACEADASIKLWDIRSIHSSRQKVPSALSATTPPSSHLNWRPFGISSLALNTDGSRLYALCKDNTVYAYSTAHLILGHAPELSTRNGEPPRRRHNAVTHQGLGPLYGFRHPSLHASSFYVKCAVRPARDGKSEVLAVGSSDNCAILFPTQERYFRDDLSGAMGALSLDNSTIATSNQQSTPITPIEPTVRRPLFRTNSTVAISARLNDDIPIVKKGTPLVRGHESEVGALTWTNEGKLVTAGDDYLIRCWSEGREDAEDLRTGGEGEGRRWGCGWAEVGEDWDVPDDDEE
ncbi:WD40 repeat-like protein [Annulohypoxylon truncatum]|uniref:WD40 repeat-like protein n=1 Tax=Annulohypoxylon truncatum TaxID=327061 RepID=UPI00200864AB|nr:WD40 repeat-like protein [Annulohypoxylon truncatum]KAI1214602.1 WD40 repeat-like protein [Annulohypoxylon truncatum]